MVHIVGIIEPVASRGVLVLLVAGLFGHGIRDRNAALGVLTYIPLLLIGLVAVVLDLARRGRGLKGCRFLLGLVGAIAIAVAAAPMVGRGARSIEHVGNTDLKILQWNVHWGGGPFRSLASWKEQRAEILKHQADLVVLSEPPESSWIDLLLEDFTPRANLARGESGSGVPERFRMVVVSNWPLRAERTLFFPGGYGLIARAEIRGQSVRILVVDGVSDPFRSRLPFLGAVADLLRTEAGAEGEFDVVLGDFNTPARSVGFDEWRALGYLVTSEYAFGWRGSFPSWLPLYDIDHVWVKKPGWMVKGSEFFGGVRSDHREQVVTISR